MKIERVNQSENTYGAASLGGAVRIIYGRHREYPSNSA